MKILAIGAHFDDPELGCGGSLLRWKSEKNPIALFVATRSGYKDAKGKTVRTDKTARAEGRESARALGAKLFEGGFPTFGLEAAEPLHRKLLRAIHEFRPDLVLTHWRDDAHQDHRALAAATLHCCRHVPKVLMYRSNWYETGGIFQPKFFVDISRTLEKKIGLIKIHDSEFTRTGGDWEKFVRAEAALAGLKSGCKYAESFEVVRWLTP
jgi:LmbE family N-acetylglucosaminyl deacetylase